MRFDPAEGHLDVLSASVQVPAAGSVVLGVRCWLMGWSLSAFAPATPIVVQLFDGGDANGDLFAVLRILGDATSVQSRGFPGQPLESGLFVTSSGGTAVGSFVIGVPA